MNNRGSAEVDASQNRQFMPAIWAAGLVGTAAVAWYATWTLYWPSDPADHARLLLSSYSTGVLPPNGLYFAVLAIVSGFSRDLSTLWYASTFVLTTSVVIKVVLSYRLAGKWLVPNRDRSTEITSRRTLLILVFVLQLGFCLPIRLPVGSASNLYLGQFPPNVWHNSTSIAAMPFVVLGFFLTASFIRDHKRVSTVLLMVVLAVGVWAKPSFFFASAPVFLLFALHRYRISRVTLKALIIVAPAALIVIVQSAQAFDPGSNSGLRIAFLHAWNFVSANPLLSLLASIAFPLSFLVLHARRLKNPMLIAYAWSHLLMGLLVYAFVTEVGPRSMHGNFGWQMIMSVYVLFLVTLIDLTNVIGSTRTTASRVAVNATLVVFGLHVTAGLYFFWAIRGLSRFP